MNKLKLFWKSTVKFVDKNLPTILSGLALVGLGGTVASAIHDTPKAQDAIIEAKKEKLKKEDAVQELNDDGSEELVMYDISGVKLTPWEYFKVLAPIYWPTAICTTATGFCIVMSNRVSKRRYAAVLAALSMQEKNIKEYQEKVKELFGEKKEEKVRHEIAKDHAMDIPEELASRYVVGQSYPCLLEIAGLPWISNRTAIEHAFNEWNRKGLKDGEAYLDDLIYELGIPVKDAWLYSHTSWDLSGGELIEPVIDSGETIDGVPCLTVRMNRTPTVN